MSHRILVFVCTCVFAVSLHASAVRQWIPAGGGSWNTPANWSGGVVPVAGDTADFSNVDLTADAIVTLDANQAVDAIIFGDTNTATAGSWIINPGSLTGATLTLSGTSTITVNALGSGKNAQINVAIAGSSGLIKAGTGTLTVTGANTYSGGTVINNGKLQAGLAVFIANSGFETPSYAAVTPLALAFAYNPIGASWTFNAGSGIAFNGSPWVTTAPEGFQIGYIQNNNTFSQDLNIAVAGTYTLAFKAANRPTYPDSGIAVQIDGTTVQTYPVGTFLSSAVFKPFTVTGIVIPAGTHTLSFVGTQSGMDSATAIDDVTLVSSTSGSLPSTTAVNITASGATLDLTGGAQTVASLTGVTGASVTNAGKLTVGDATDFAFPGVISGSGALTKAGTGTFTLTGTNTYTGLTTISTGTLQIGNGTTNGSIAASAGIVDNAALVFNVAGSQSCSTVISGSGSFTKAGTGTLTLFSANTYTGATVVSAGALKLAGTPSVLGINYFKITGDSDSQLSTSNTYTHAINPSGGAEVVNGIPFTGAPVGSVSSLNSQTYTQPGTGTVTIANSIAASDFGVLALTNLNTWSSVTGNILNLFSHFNYNTAPVRTVVLTGLQANTWYDVRLYEKQYDTSTGRSFSVAYDVGNNGSVEATTPTIDQNHPESTGALSAVGIAQTNAWAVSYVFKTGTAQTSIALTINNLVAATYHFYGVSNQLATGGDNRLPITTALSIAAGATLDLGGGNQQVASLANFGSGGGVVINSNSTVAATFTMNPTSGGTTFSGVIGGGGGAISLVKSGNGTQILSGINTYTGVTTISAGTLQVGDGVTDGSISASASITNNATLAFNVIGSTQSYGNVISGTGSLTKSGVGTLTLSGSNTYGGNTTVNAGTLLCTNTSGSATGTGNVTVNATGTIAGTGTISGTLTVNGGSVSPGNGGAGTLMTGAAVFNAASTLVSDVGTATDLLIVQGNLTIDGTVNVTLGAGAGAGVYTVVSYTGTLTDNTLVAGATAGYTPTVVTGGGFVRLTLSAGTATTLTASPVSPSVFGQSVAFTGTVSPVAPAVGAPTGSLVFVVDGVSQPPITLVNGSASLSLSTLDIGAHTIQTNFVGASTFTASTVSLSHTVNKAATTLTFATNANPSPDGLVTITATIAAIAPGGGVPTGSVTFVVDGITQPVATLVNGVATLQLTLDSGLHSITGQYSGSARYIASNSKLTQSVKPSFSSPPTLTPNPAVTGQLVTATVGVGNAVVTWSWGDGTSATGVPAGHTYSAPGIYIATVTASIGGESVTQTLQIFIGLGLQGGGEGGAVPGVTGILVGGTGAGAAQGGSGKIVCNYIRREKTTFSGSLGGLGLPTTLTQDQLTAKNGTLVLGTGALAQQFSFILGKSGRGKSTGLPQISLNVKKKAFKFKAQRAELTDLMESLGAPRQFELKKGQVITLMVPATLQIETNVFIALTFQVKYQQISNGAGKGAL